MPQAYPEQPHNRREAPPGALQLGRGTWVRPTDMEWDFTTARGPGGQHVNKTSTAAILRVPVRAIGGLDADATARLISQCGRSLVGGTEILLRSDMYRSQLRNREACTARLKTLVSHAAIRPKVRKKTKPTRGSIERRLQGKKRASTQKSNRRWDDGE